MKSLIVSATVLALTSLQSWGSHTDLSDKGNQHSAADAAWEIFQHLDKSNFMQNEMSGEQRRAKLRAIHVARSAVAEYFYDNHAGDPRRWEAALEFVNLTLYYLPKFYRVQVADAETRKADEIQALLKSNASLPKEIRTRLWDEITYWSAVPLLTAKEPNPPGARPAIDRFVSMFPDSPRSAVYEEIYVSALNSTDPSAALQWAKKLAMSPSGPVKEFAAAWIRRSEASSRPVEMRFTSVDGRVVDLSELKGKVVLIDFWATWCHWCLDQMPHIVRAYDKYRDKGFEVVGVSLDREKDREKMLQYIDKYDMRWPHHYDGKGMENAWAKHFAVSSIPQAWLLGKDGRLVHRGWKSEDLETRVRQELGLDAKSGQTPEP